jgi:hypothetical protein
MEINESRSEGFGRGIKLSKVVETLGSFDLAVFLGKLQQSGWVRIIYDSKLDDEPRVQLTEKGKQQALALLFSSG